MATDSTDSEFRVEKQRANAVVTLSRGEVMRGCFFTASATAARTGPERVGDLLNADRGFLPFEIPDGSQAPRTVLLNRRHIVMVALDDNEAARDPGYSVATRRVVTVVLSDGGQVTGEVRVYRPDGRDRLSDWARQPGTFRYLETAAQTLVLNTAHVVKVSEVDS